MSCAQLHHRAPPGVLHVAQQQHADRAVVVGRPEPAVDLGRREHEAPALAQVDDLVEQRGVGSGGLGHGRPVYGARRAVPNRFLPASTALAGPPPVRPRVPGAVVERRRDRLPLPGCVPGTPRGDDRRPDGRDGAAHRRVPDRLPAVRLGDGVRGADPAQPAGRVLRGARQRRRRVRRRARRRRRRVRLPRSWAIASTSPPAVTSRCRPWSGWRSSACTPRCRGRRGCTPGKAVFGVKVVNEQGGKPGFGRGPRAHAAVDRRRRAVVLPPGRVDHRPHHEGAPARRRHGGQDVRGRQGAHRSRDRAGPHDRGHRLRTVRRGPRAPRGGRRRAGPARPPGAPRPSRRRRGAARPRVASRPRARRAEHAGGAAHGPPAQPAHGRSCRHPVRSPAGCTRVRCHPVRATRRPRPRRPTHRRRPRRRARPPRRRAHRAPPPPRPQVPALPRRDEPSRPGAVARAPLARARPGNPHPSPTRARPPLPPARPRRPPLRAARPARSSRPRPRRRPPRPGRPRHRATTHSGTPPAAPTSCGSPSGASGWAGTRPPASGARSDRRPRGHAPSARGRGCRPSAAAARGGAPTPAPPGGPPRTPPAAGAR